jgi:hypothetical protein
MSEKMKHWGHTLANVRVQPLQHMQHLDLLLNIHVKQLKHISKASETFRMYTRNMHHILVRPSPSSASGRCSRRKRRGRRASAPRPSASPCAGSVVGRGGQRSRSNDTSSRAWRAHKASIGTAAEVARRAAEWEMDR